MDTDRKLPEGSDQKTILASAATPADAPLGSAPNVVAARDVRYAFSSLHASGGIGRVWLARDRHLDREVAVKELLPGMAGDARVLARFLREARLTGQLAHPGIVPVYELVATDGRQPFYTMRFVRGRTLSEAVNAYHAARAEGKPDPLDFVRLLTAFATVCNTIAYAHSRGVLHRDLKGQNVVLGDFGEVIVLDWGLAKLMGQPDEQEGNAGTGDLDALDDPTLTVQGDVVGTPAFMAPEQAEGRHDQIDQRTDIFGLGAMLYEILTGQPPFVGTSTVDVLKKAARGQPPPPRQLLPEVPPALEAVCLKALAKNPSERYESAALLAQEVQRWQDVQRRQAEEELRQSRERFELAVRGSQDGLWDWDLRTNDVYYSPRWKELIGYEDHEIANRIEEWDVRLHPDEREQVLAANHAHIDGTTPYYEYEYRLRHKDGSYRWILARGVALRDAAGKAYRMAGSHVDITERKQAAQAMRDSEERYQAVLEALPLAIVVYQADGSVATHNSAAKQLLGMDGGHPSPEWAGADGTPLVWAAHPAAVSLRTGQPGTASLLALNGDGMRRPVRVSAEPLFRAGEPRPYAVVATYYGLADLGEGGQHSGPQVYQGG